MQKHSKYITTRAKLLYGNDLENVLIMTWVQLSDEFEPNSLSKSLRGGVWIKKITFLSNNPESNSIRDTCPILISFKHISHDFVEKNISTSCMICVMGKIIDSILTNYKNS